MHTLTLPTASLKRGISMMEGSQTCSLHDTKETSESFFEGREPRTPIMHEAGQRNACPCLIGERST